MQDASPTCVAASPIAIRLSIRSIEVGLAALLLDVVWDAHAPEAHLRPRDQPPLQRLLKASHKAVLVHVRGALCRQAHLKDRLQPTWCCISCPVPANEPLLERDQWPYTLVTCVNVLTCAMSGSVALLCRAS